MFPKLKFDNNLAKPDFSTFKQLEFASKNVCPFARPNGNMMFVCDVM